MTKEELLNRVKADTAVEEGSLTSHIFLLRKTLGEQYIESIPKRGRRFMGAVTTVTNVSEQETQIRSLSVLPLENLGRDADGEYSAESMTEALMTNLAKISALRVVSRTSVLGYKNTHKSIPEIGRELRVDALTEGSVQCESNRVRINARLAPRPSENSSPPQRPRSQTLTWTRTSLA